MQCEENIDSQINITGKHMRYPTKIIIEYNSNEDSPANNLYRNECQFGPSKYFLISKRKYKKHGSIRTADLNLKESKQFRILHKRIKGIQNTKGRFNIWTPNLNISEPISEPKIKEKSLPQYDYHKRKIRMIQKSFKGNSVYKKGKTITLSRLLNNMIDYDEEISEKKPKLHKIPTYSASNLESLYYK